MRNSVCRATLSLELEYYPDISEDESDFLDETEVNIYGEKSIEEVNYLKCDINDKGLQKIIK